MNRRIDRKPILSQRFLIIACIMVILCIFHYQEVQINYKNLTYLHFLIKGSIINTMGMNEYPEDSSICTTTSSLESNKQLFIDGDIGDGYLYGLVLLSTGKWADAKVFFSRTESIVSNYALGWAYWCSDSPLTAIEVWKRTNTKAGGYFLLKGREYVSNQKLPQAIKWLELANSVQPASAEILFALCQAYFQSGKLESADNACDQAILTGDISSGMYLWSGLVKGALGDHAAAKKRVEIAVQWEPDFWYNLFIYANILDSEGNWIESEQWYRKVVDEKPDFSDGYIKLGISLFNQKKLDEAYQIFKRHLVCESRPKWLIPYLISLYPKLKDSPDKGSLISIYTLALQCEPGSADLMNILNSQSANPSR